MRKRRWRDFRFHKKEQKGKELQTPFLKRKGTKKTRVEKKKNWIKRVRSQRKTLKELREKNPKAVEAVGYGKVYRMIKGNYFKGKKYVEAYVKGKKEAGK